jgi:predicted alpha/beta-hydrolase family hydrolase
MRACRDKGDYWPMKLTTPAGKVSAVLDAAKDQKALCVLGHGAGAGIRSDYMDAFARGFRDRQISVFRFNFAYMESGKRSPDKQPILEATMQAAIEAAREHSGDVPLFAGGKSLGGRIASHVVAAGVDVAGLVFLGYPLHPPGRPDRIRDQHLMKIRVPMLFVEGTRDPFCPLEGLERVRSKLLTETSVAVIEDGDHSLKVRKSSGRDTAEAWQEAINVAADWMLHV